MGVGMNERIRELARKAGIDIRHVKKHADEEFGDQLATFAELIVKECITVGYHAFINDHSVVPTFPVEKIKENFGIKE
jgi:hypothetical protein